PLVEGAGPLEDRDLPIQRLVLLVVRAVARLGLREDVALGAQLLELHFERAEPDALDLALGVGDAHARRFGLVVRERVGDADRREFVRGAVHLATDRRLRALGLAADDRVTPEDLLFEQRDLARRRLLLTGEAL